MTQTGTFLLALWWWWASMWTVRACGWGQWCRDPDSPGCSLWVVGAQRWRLPREPSQHRLCRWVLAAVCLRVLRGSLGAPLFSPAG